MSPRSCRRRRLLTGLVGAVLTPRCATGPAGDSEVAPRGGRAPPPAAMPYDSRGMWRQMDEFTYETLFGRPMYPPPLDEDGNPIIEAPRRIQLKEDYDEEGNLIEFDLDAYLKERVTTTPSEAIGRLLSRGHESRSAVGAHPRRALDAARRVRGLRAPARTCTSAPRRAAGRRPATPPKRCATAARRARASSGARPRPREETVTAADDGRCRPRRPRRRRRRARARARRLKRHERERRERRDSRERRDRASAATHEGPKAAIAAEARGGDAAGSTPAAGAADDAAPDDDEPDARRARGAVRARRGRRGRRRRRRRAVRAGLAATRRRRTRRPRRRRRRLALARVALGRVDEHAAAARSRRARTARRRPARSAERERRRRAFLRLRPAVTPPAAAAR